MSKLEKEPLIRFIGFTGAWELRKLGELGTVQTCKRIFKEETSENGEIPFYKNGTLGLETDSYISRERYEEFKKLYPYPEVGDILISVVGSIGRTAEYMGKDEYFQDSNVVWLKTDGLINKKFLKISYQVINWLIEGSTIKHLYNDNILRSEIMCPKSQIEQQKIGDYFQNFNNLITLYQRKCDLLEQTKKTYLQKLFPRDGENVPEMRFAGFEGEWQEKKLGEQYIKVNEKNDLSFGTDKIISVANMYFKEEVIESDNDYMRTYNIMRLGDIAFEGNKSKHFARGRFVENTIGDGIVSHVFDVFRPIAEYDLQFWKYLINNEGVMGRIMPRCTNSSTMMTNLVADDFLKEEIAIPTVEEQTQIGTFFETLDTHITHHEEKLTTLKTIKQTLLKQMFI